MPTIGCSITWFGQFLLNHRMALRGMGVIDCLIGIQFFTLVRLHQYRILDYCLVVSNWVWKFYTPTALFLDGQSAHRNCMNSFLICRKQLIGMVTGRVWKRYSNRGGAIIFRIQFFPNHIYVKFSHRLRSLLILASNQGNSIGMCLL